MSKHNENKLIPELRFPQFINSEGWKKNSIGNVVDLQSGFAFQSIYFSENGKKLLTPKNFTKDGYAVFDIDNTKFTIENCEPKFICKEGDLLLLLTDLTPSCELLGKPLLLKKNDGEVLLNQRIVRITPKVECVHTEFLFFFFLTERFHKRIKDTATGSTVRHSSNSIISETSIFIPKEEEQQKIVACLLSLDEVIHAECNRLDFLQHHKRGLLQNLFPVGRENTPKFRFEEFEESDEWVEDTLINLANFRRGSFPQPYGLPEWYDDENGMPFIQVFDVGEDFRLKPITKRKISELAAQQSVFIPKGTLIITIQGSIGRVAITQYEAYIDRTLLLFEEFHQEIDLTFFAYTIFLLFEIEKQKAPGGIIKTITKEVLSSFVVKLPSIEEQRKIANCLSSLDELNIAQNEKIEALKQHKKGLLQRLFPNLNEVTE